MSKLKCVQERTLSTGVQAWYIYCSVITAGNVDGEQRRIEEELERMLVAGTAGAMCHH